MQPTDQQAEQYRRDGFVVVERLLPEDEVAAVVARFAPLFARNWATGVAPDEVNDATANAIAHTAATDGGQRTLQLCNAWKADPVVAATTRSARQGEFAALLENAPGMVLLQDNVLWKPPLGLAIGAHRDNSYNGWLDPVNMTTCWMALDDTAADTGTIWYVRGSHRWAPSATGDNFHAPDDWLALARAQAPAGIDVDSLLAPVEVPAGGAAFHHGWTFHGSPPNERPDRQRRSVVSHLGRLGTRHHPTVRHPVYSRWFSPGSLELDPAQFPVVWTAEA